MSLNGWDGGLGRGFLAPSRALGSLFLALLPLFGVSLPGRDRFCIGQPNWSPLSLSPLSLGVGSQIDWLEGSATSLKLSMFCIAPDFVFFTSPTGPLLLSFWIEGPTTSLNPPTGLPKAALTLQVPGAPCSGDGLDLYMTPLFKLGPAWSGLSGWCTFKLGAPPAQDPCPRYMGSSGQLAPLDPSDACLVGICATLSLSLAAGPGLDRAQQQVVPPQIEVIEWR